MGWDFDFGEVDADLRVVGEDLIRYMTAAASYAGDFLVDDPNWAIDFAPKGKIFGKIGGWMLANLFSRQAC